MKQTLLSSLLFFTILINNAASLNFTEYQLAVEKLALDAKFIEEYTKWSLELLSDSDYLYGPPSAPFPCTTEGMRSAEPPKSVHALRPGDIQCVAALGDSLTAGMGAHALTPIGVLLENRGISLLSAS